MAGSYLRRAIRLPQATAMVVGTIIGTAIFVQPSEVTGQVPTVGGVFTVWLVCGVLTLFGALVCAELSSIFTRSGGVYVYLKEAYSPAVGFLWGWAMFWTMHSGIIAAIATVCGRYTAYLVELDDNGIKAVGIAVIVLLSAVNYAGVRQGSQLQTLFTVGKIIAIAVIIAAGFWFGAGAHERVLEAGAATLEVPVPAGSGAETAAVGARTGTFGVTEFLLALVAGLFAFGGWHMVTYNSEETVEPRTTVPRALIIGTGIVTFCYVAMNAVYMWVLPLETIAASTRVAADAADAVWGSGGGSMMSALALVALLLAVTWIPGVLLFFMQSGMARWSWFATNWMLGAGIFFGFLLWIMLVGLVALASSAYVKWRIVAGALVLGVFFVMAGAAEVTNAVLRVRWASAFNPGVAMNQIWRSMLGVDPLDGAPGAVACLLALGAMVVVLLAVVERRLRPVQVVS